VNKNHTFLHNIITTDDTWCFLYNSQTKLELTWWKSPSYQWKIKCLQEGDAWDIFWQQKYHTQGIHSCGSYNYKGMVSPRTIFSVRSNPQETARHVNANSWMSLHPCLVGTDKSWKCCPTMPTTFSRHHPMWHFYVCTAEENTTQLPFKKCKGYHGHDTWQKEMHFSTTSKTSMPTGRDALKWTETNLKQLLHGKPCPQIITHDSSNA